jgi:hypothetical protein
VIDNASIGNEKSLGHFDELKMDTEELQGDETLFAVRQFQS